MSLQRLCLRATTASSAKQLFVNSKIGKNNFSSISVLTGSSNDESRVHTTKCEEVTFDNYMYKQQSNLGMKCINQQESNNIMSFFDKNKYNNIQFHSKMFTSSREFIHLQTQHPATPVTLGWFDTTETTKTTTITNQYYDDSSLNCNEIQQHQQHYNDEETVNSRSNIVYELLNRNARRGKRANRGKRPVSRQARRKKRRSIGNHRR
jgi:hypothetical protein